MSRWGSACGPWCSFCGGCTSGPKPNAECSQCGEAYHRDREDVGDLCDRCCDERDDEDRDERPALAVRTFIGVPREHFGKVEGKPWSEVERLRDAHGWPTYGPTARPPQQSGYAYVYEVRPGEVWLATQGW